MAAQRELLTAALAERSSAGADAGSGAGSLPVRVPAWHTAGADNTRRGCFGRVAGLKGQPIRQLQATAAVQAAVVFDEQDTAFVADMSGSLQAFDANGKCLWRISVAGGVATPAVAPSGNIIGATLFGELCVVRAADGTIISRRSISTKSDPRILSDVLYLPQAGVVVVSSWGGRFVALESASGEEKFAWDAGISPCAAPAADAEEEVYCVRAVEGKGVELLQVAIGGKAVVLRLQPEEKRGGRRAVVAAAPVLDPERGRLYAILNGDRQGRLVAWSLTNQALAWERVFDHCVQATPAVALDGTIVVADLGGYVHALAPDGSVRYRYSGGCEYWLAAPVVDGAGTVYIGDPCGRLHVIDPRGTGSQLFEAPRAIQARGAFDSAGRFYLPCTDGRVYVFAS